MWVVGFTMKVLILDSHLMDVIKMEDSCRERGFEVARLTGSYGVMSKIDFESPDVLLIDPQMPGVDVFALVSALRGVPKFDDLVIIAVSSDSGDSVRDLCVTVDFNAYYLKEEPLEGIGEFIVQCFEEE